MIRATLRTSDVAARLHDGTYGLMLEDTPEDGAVWAVERLRRSLATRPGGRVLRAGVACYPGQALTPTDIVLAAQAAFATAREWPQDRIEVAPPTRSSSLACGELLRASFGAPSARATAGRRPAEPDRLPSGGLRRSLCPPRPPPGWPTRLVGAQALPGHCTAPGVLTAARPGPASARRRPR